MVDDARIKLLNVNLGYKNIIIKLGASSSSVDNLPARFSKPCRSIISPNRNSFLLFILLFSVSFFAQAQVKTSIDSTKIRIGEQINYTIQVQTDSSAAVIFPDGKTFAPLELIEDYKIDTTYENSKYNLIKKYGLTQFDSGHYTIPQQRVVINSKAFLTDSLKVEVADVVVDTTKQKMFDIKPAVEIQKPNFNWLKLLYWLLPILLIAGIIFYFFRRKKLREAAEKELPPYEEAIVALKKLDEKQLLKEHRSKEYYSFLTEIVKRYLDREVDSTALESTSDELITRLMMHKDSGNFDFDLETIQDLDKVLKRADLVKFAKMEQLEGQAQTDRATVEEIINETHEAVPEPTEEELLQNEIYLEELRKKRERKKRIYIISGIASAIILAAVIFGAVTGFDNLSDKVFGNKLRSLSEARWVKSEYGNPSIILETPEVLVRNLVDNPEGANIKVAGKDVFTFGQMKDKFYISVSTTNYNGKQEITLDKALDAQLNELEKSGAKNMIVKREDFETQKGIKGLKAYGIFNVQVSDDKVQKDESEYELLLFAQDNGLQEVLVVYKNDGKYAEEIKKRIDASVELEITEKQNAQ